MRGLYFVTVIAAAVSVSTAALAYPGGMPQGTFACNVLLAESLTGTSSDRFAPSVLGTFEFNSYGSYTRQGKTGAVVLEGGVIRFTSGEATGIVAKLKDDPYGRAYLHIDGEVTTAPLGAPKLADFVCYQQ